MNARKGTRPPEGGGGDERPPAPPDRRDSKIEKLKPRHISPDGLDELAEKQFTEDVQTGVSEVLDVADVFRKEYRKRYKLRTKHASGTSSLQPAKLPQQKAIEFALGLELRTVLYGVGSELRDLSELIEAAVKLEDGEVQSGEEERPEP